MEKQEVEKEKKEPVKDNQMSDNLSQTKTQNINTKQQVSEKLQEKQKKKNQETQIKGSTIAEQQEVSHKQISLTKTQMQLKQELQSMQFEKDLILEAIQQTNNLEQAIELIISKIQANEQKQMIGTSANEVKVYFIVRMDLKMGTGKIAAQVGHAALKGFQQMRYSASINDKNASLLIEWMQTGKKSMILQAETQNEIRGYLDRAGEKLINNCYIRDAGRTQIAAGSMTVGAIGPVRQCDVGFLKNLKQL